MRYIILIAFIMLGSGTESLFERSAEYKIQLAQANRTINILTAVRERPEVYMFKSPMAPGDFKRLTSPYGYRELLNLYTGGTRESIHHGVDILGTYHARITAIADGIVTENYPVPNGYYKGHELLGGMIKIQHANGYSSVYGHLSAIYIHEGQNVKAGQIIGRQGNTGQSQGEHLHLEIQLNNIALNPLKYIEELE
jgi:murein DD-endopeptidase MepM/ murein hydrolase activator NlpD